MRLRGRRNRRFLARCPAVSTSVSVFLHRMACLRRPNDISMIYFMRCPNHPGVCSARRIMDCRGAHCRITPLNGGQWRHSRAPHQGPHVNPRSPQDFPVKEQ